MHVKAKTMAFSGLLLALTVIFMVLDEAFPFFSPDNFLNKLSLYFN